LIFVLEQLLAFEKSQAEPAVHSYLHLDLSFRWQMRVDFGAGSGLSGSKTVKKIGLC
jgi:hypothetical protein